VVVVVVVVGSSLPSGSVVATGGSIGSVPGEPGGGVPGEPGGGVPVEDGPVESVVSMGVTGSGLPAGTSSSSSVNFMSSAAPTTPTATAVATPMPPDEPADSDVGSALTELARGKINNNAVAKFLILNITGSYLIN
jgi:hypothetical protein